MLPPAAAMGTRQAKHCPLCGAALAPGRIEGRERLRCTRCRYVLYENPAGAAAAVVVDAGDRVLLIRRALDPYKGSWALPAGYQEFDEDPRQTVVREVFEETGVQAEVVELLDVIFVPDDPRKPANVTVYLCRSIGGRISPGDDAMEARWFSLDALPENLGFESNLRILEAIRGRRHESD